MKKRDRNSRIAWMCAWACAFALPVPAQTANPVYTAQTLTAGRTYAQGATVTYSSVTGGLEVDFGNGSFPPGGLTMATVDVDSGNTASLFTGDYLASNINALTFEVIGSGFLPDAALVELRGASGRRWRYGFKDQLKPQTGVAAQVHIPLTIGSGWTTPWAGESHSLFAADLQHVTLCSIVLMPGKPAANTFLPAQSYQIRVVTALTDPTVSPPLVNLSPLAQALTRRFGYGIEDEEDLTDTLRAVDLDQDTLKDYQEAFAEHDANFAASLLQLKWGLQAPPLGLHWPAVRGQTYRLMGAESIGPGAPPSTRIAEITPAETGVVQPALPGLDGKLRYFWIEWEPTGYE